MYKDMLKAKERGDEEQYFRRRDEELIARLRERAHLQELTHALAEKLQVDDPALLKRIADLGITRDTGPAFLLAPLVQIAWAEGQVTSKERETILGIAEGRGIEAGSPAHQQLVAWFDERPSAEVFDAAVQAIKAGISVLPEAERAERIKAMVAMCHRVAGASGGLARFLGLSSGVAHEEEQVLESIGARLRAQP